MKLYFAYRSGYHLNTRHIIELEGDSIFEWFYDNWEQLCTPNYFYLFGTEVHGFPIHIKDKNAVVKEKNIFQKIFNVNSQDDLVFTKEKPKDFKQLLDFLYKGLHINHINNIEGEEDFIQILTDDDEIELSWYVFTEDYKNKNYDKVAIWFQENLPLTVGLGNVELKEDESYTLRFDIEDKPGYIYFISCPIYDESNLEDIQVVKIPNLRLPDLLPMLKNNKIPEDDVIFYATEELRYLRYIAKQLGTDNLEEVLDVFVKIPITELQHIIFEEYNLEDILEMPLESNRDLSSLLVTDHLVEINSYVQDSVYNYYVLFDDLWASKHPELAKSIIHFGSSIHI